jgi:hypothetical protein
MPDKSDQLNWKSDVSYYKRQANSTSIAIPVGHFSFFDYFLVTSRTRQ